MISQRIFLTWVYKENYNSVNNQEALKQELKQQILVQLSPHRLLRNICAELWTWCSNKSPDAPRSGCRTHQRRKLTFSDGLYKRPVPTGDIFSALFSKAKLRFWAWTDLARDEEEVGGCNSGKRRRKRSCTYLGMFCTQDILVALHS